LGATADNYLRAFDEQPGQQLWHTRLPAGGHGGLRIKLGDPIAAYALPNGVDEDTSAQRSMLTRKNPHDPLETNVKTRHFMNHHMALCGIETLL
jgi:hypothetical protein